MKRNSLPIRPLPVLVFVTLLLICHLVAAESDRGFKIISNRYALVIGNGAYPISPLKNPVNDAEDMARILEKLRFKVIHRQDAGLKEMETSVRKFGRMLEKGGTGVFYYAGHGMQVDGRNYLLPVDAIIESPSDVRFAALDVGRVLGKMEDAGNGLNIIILDACRDNPYARQFRSTRNGLARMDAPRGTLIAYATGPGSVAADGDGRNGVYTRNLLKHISTPGMPVEQVFKHVRVDVISDTSQKQVPWESSSLTGNFYFAPAAADNSKNGSAPRQASGSPENQEVLYWEFINDSDNPALFQAYLEKYPDGVFSEKAQIQFNRLQSNQLEKIKLRAKSTTITSESDIDKMVARYAFYERSRNPHGNPRSSLIPQNDQIVIDRLTGLMWQRAGSESALSFLGAANYVKQLNKEKFAGHHDWRLPTIDELASLIAKKKAHDLYISSVFNRRQKKCWSSDEAEGMHDFPGESAAWIVDYTKGKINKANWFRGMDDYYTESYSQDIRNYVKAVRSTH